MSKKKILILTHRLGLNYGGMAQAYALQVVLRDLGFDPVSSNFLKKDIVKNAYQQSRYVLRRALYKVGMNVSDLPTCYPDYTTQNTTRFIEQHIATEKSSILNRKYVEENYYALISGSDQVWRSSYVPVEKYLFDFAEESKTLIRISYAASFGKDNLDEYSKRLVSRTKKLAQRFSAISVREDSGIALVDKYWNRKAEQHVDPTLLLNTSDYLEIIENEKEFLIENDGQIFLYFLDPKSLNYEIAEKVSRRLGLKTFEIMPPKPKSRKELLGNLESFQLPSVGQWLKCFADSKFVITDSFHGTVFSILFNKPFIAIGNRQRGLSRFVSLMKLFDLETRLVTKLSDVTDELLLAEINWDEVELEREKQVSRARKYLLNYLSQKRQLEFG
ncbi:polysaccharide pyruvyl transferase family protein [Corynebacterium glutamicum]|uniref:polysaccharide pyruvyl transferase family protein n=1 Tax=Corynebacterium glutamicum TaxID=1718 RepID=UPI000744C201|nr:polysaccharide pyruvyl transferase family protein [Corynebacterium glutamicum]ALZ99143.1 hypothetical protein APT58_02250 [Corynebacterium glutamicum]